MTADPVIGLLVDQPHFQRYGLPDAIRPPPASLAFALGGDRIAAEAIGFGGIFRVEDLDDILIIKQLGLEDLPVEQFDDLRMGQGADGVEILRGIDQRRVGLRDRAPITDPNHLIQSIIVPQLANLRQRRGGVFRVSSKNFRANGAPLGIAQETYDHLFMPLLAIPVRAEGVEITVGILALQNRNWSDHRAPTGGL